MAPCHLFIIHVINLIVDAVVVFYALLLCGKKVFEQIKRFDREIKRQWV